MRPPSRARLLRIPLGGNMAADRASLLVRGDVRPFALTGAWAGGGALVGSEPLVVAEPDDDPFALLDAQPVVEGADAADAVGGGWFGYLGYGLGARLEPVPPPPPRPAPLPDFVLAWYDHLLRLDREGRWWFEALWTEERDAALRERRERLAGRLAAGVRERPVWVGPFKAAAPGAAGHVAAVETCRERIAEGEIFQANICLRLESRFEGNPADLFAHTTSALGPRHAAFVGGPWGALCSLSPELFLRRRGRDVLTEPIKGHRAARARGPRRPRRVGQGPRRERDDRRPDAQRPRTGVRVRERACARADGTASRARRVASRIERGGAAARWARGR
jgi:para-aminobenzoate synthetase/4-amino-4-deoxychorismate lyase